MMIQVNRKKWQKEILLPIGGSQWRSAHCSLVQQAWGAAAVQEENLEREKRLMAFKTLGAI